MLEISNTSLDEYQLCQKRTYWSRVKHLKPRRKSSALSLGSIVHSCFDMYYKSKSFSDISKFINDTYKDTLNQAGMDEYEDDLIAWKTCLGMVLNFPFKQLIFDEIFSEEEFSIPLTKDITFIGRIDGRAKIKGKWYVREVKTTSQKKSDFEKKASVSGQATGYIFACIQLHNVDIQGALYDYMRKPLLRKREYESAEEFADRIYLDYCDKKKSDSYFDRYSTYRNPHEIKLWLADTLKVATQIQHSLDNDDFPRNTSACYAFNTECPYKKICFLEHIDQLTLDLFYEQK